MTTQQLADKIIKELQDAGFDYDGMLRVLKLAKEKYEATKKQEDPVCPECNSDLIFDFDTKYACDECGFAWNKNE